MAAWPASAQEAAAPAPAASAPPAARPRPPADPASAPAGRQLDKVEITGGRPSDVQERRQSTAAKIIVGREEIEKYGDSTLGEVLKRLPGVTMSGPPGRGSGGPRMRGLGSGYTLILLDGQRSPPGFSIESIEPDQVERIEILRAPTAETGGRAIAGVINIVTREGFRKKLNSLRVGTAYENGNFQPGFSWTRNDTAGDWIYNWSVNAFKGKNEDDSVITRQRFDLPVETLVESTRETSHSTRERTGLNGNGRLQWRGEKGMQAVLQPFFFVSEGKTERQSRMEQTGGSTAPAYSQAESSGDSRNQMVRLNAEWRQPLSETGRLELKTGVGQFKYRSSSAGVEQRTDGPHTRSDREDGTDTSGHVNAKYSLSLENEQTFVTGFEAESNKRREESLTLYDGNPLLNDTADNLSARTLRLAAYAQDEWTLSPNWSAHAGLRWESIEVDSDAYDDGTSGLAANVSNRSRVWTPLLHAVWKPDPKGNDQVRMSLTRTYRSPSLGTLIARPSVNSRAPLDETPSPDPSNSATTADRAGNPDLKPELATGLDVAYEHYLSQGGLLSANVFYRRISDYMRSVTSIQTVNYTGRPRWVSRTENIGDATTQGLELEARFRLSDAIEGAPRVDVRMNASLFHSKVKPVPGPDNRLDQQPDGTANIGADYKLPTLPLTIGGSLNWTPGYTTRVTEVQWQEVGNKLQGDAFVQWTISPAMQLRVSASNVAPRDYVTGSRFESASSRDLSETTQTTRVNWQLRLEMKL